MTTVFPTMPSAGCSILFLSGTYYLGTAADPIVIPINNVRITGEGPSSEFKTVVAGTGVFYSDKNRIIIENIKITNTTGGAAYTLRFDSGGSDVDRIIRNVYMNDLSWSAIQGDHMIVDSCVIKATVPITLLAHSVVSNSYLDCITAGNYCLTISQLLCVASNNFLEGGGVADGLIFCSSDLNTITGNAGGQCIKEAVRVAAGNNNVISSNTFYVSRREMMRIEGSNNTIVDNICWNPSLTNDNTDRKSTRLNSSH
jgi:hypothetical protein